MSDGWWKLSDKWWVTIFVEPNSPLDPYYRLKLKFCNKLFILEILLAKCQWPIEVTQKNKNFQFAPFGQLLLFIKHIWLIIIYFYLK